VLPSEPRQFSSWPEFYRQIYDAIWNEVAAGALVATRTRKIISKVHDRLDRLIVHSDCPRLVHWDIWTSNILAAADAGGHWRISAVLDPNCKFAHTEAEIAYMELFHTITPAFTKAYQHAFRLDEHYHRVRKHVYQLYPLINHVNLFGREYVEPLNQVAERLGAVV
jgi:fructosamine-3-kinase